MTQPHRATDPTTIHLVPHTHWDREWYRPFQIVPDAARRPRRPRPRHARGGARLRLHARRPARHHRRLPRDPARAGGAPPRPRPVGAPRDRPVADPDGRVPRVSGETLVRNLERGWARADDFGGPMRVGYLPDMFGHVAQMPQILRRAGLDDAVVWRGVPAVDRPPRVPLGGARRLVGARRVPAVRLRQRRRPVRRARGASMPRPGALRRLGTAVVRRRPGARHVRHRPHRTRPGAGRTRQPPQRGAGTRAACGSRRSPSTSTPRADLTDADPCWRGEMRSGARANVLMGVASARIDIKQAAGRAETLLERYAEPLTALHVAPDAWPAAFLRLAWGKVIENSAHDSICGCSIDPVVDQVLVRFAEAEQIASTLARRAAAAVGARRAARRGRRPQPDARRPRSGLVEAELLVPEAWAEVALELARRHAASRPRSWRARSRSCSTRSCAADQVEDLFRRFHGREVFDHAWNGYRIEGRTITFDVDSDPEPAWLDVDGLARRGDARRCASAPGRRVAHPHHRQRARRTLAAARPGPGPRLDGSARRGGRTATVTDGVRMARDGRTMTNGLLAVARRRRRHASGSRRPMASSRRASDASSRAVTSATRTTTARRRPTGSSTSRRDRGPSPDLLGPVRGRLRRAPDLRLARAAPTRTAPRAPTAASRPRSSPSSSSAPASRSSGWRSRSTTGPTTTASASTPRSPAAPRRRHAEGQFAVVERGTHRRGRLPRGAARPPTRRTAGSTPAGSPSCSTTSPSTSSPTTAASWRSRSSARPGSSAATTTRTARTRPAPRSRSRTAQMRGRWRIDFALLPHAGDWAAGGVAGRRRAVPPRPARLAGAAPQPTPRGRPADAGTPSLELERRGRRAHLAPAAGDGWLEARIVNLAPVPVSATPAGRASRRRAARTSGASRARRSPWPTATLALDLGPAEIRTVQLRRTEIIAGPRGGSRRRGASPEPLSAG